MDTSQPHPILIGERLGWLRDLQALQDLLLELLEVAQPALVLSHGAMEWLPFNLALVQGCWHYPAGGLVAPASPQLLIQLLEQVAALGQQVNQQIPVVVGVGHRFDPAHAMPFPCSVRRSNLRYLTCHLGSLGDALVASVAFQDLLNLLVLLEQVAEGEDRGLIRDPGSDQFNAGKAAHGGGLNQGIFHGWVAE